MELRGPTGIGRSAGDTEAGTSLERMFDILTGPAARHTSRRPRFWEE
jgi:hypothetical protein